MKRILLLGGTRFIGRLFLERLLAQDEAYDISLFHRGKTGADLFPHIRKVHGDRETADIEQVTNTDWDYVIDFSAYYPNSLRDFLQQSKGRIGRMIFISTVSTYELTKDVTAPLTEDAPLWDCTVEQRTDTSMQTYGNRKVACERELLDMQDLDKIILRPSVVFGKYDYINRHMYWLHRAETQPRILLPNGGNQTDNYTFVEDLAELILQSMQIKQHRTIYNASTQRVHTLRELVETATQYAGTNPELVAFPADKLAGNRVSLWNGINVAFDHQRALQDFGIQYHTMEQSMIKTIDYYRSIQWAGLEELEKRYMTEAQEQELLKSLNG